MNNQLNPFLQLLQQNQSSNDAQINAPANSDQNRAIAEVQASMMIARMNPRNQIKAMDNILNACTRPALAEGAVYQYARGGQDISGPSIRLAETIAQSWGNIQFGTRELDQSNGVSTVLAYAWDVETNVRKEVVFQVPHERHTRAGKKQLTDPRDIYEAVANNGSRRTRNCILAIIPGDVIDAAVTQCDITLKSQADTSPETIQKMVDAFSVFGVTKAQIEKRIQRRLDAIQAAQVVSLKKIYASLRDGMSNATDWFDGEVKEKTAKNILIDALDLISNCASYEEVQAIDLYQLGIVEKDMKIVVKAWEEKAGSFANSIVDDAGVDFDAAI